MLKKKPFSKRHGYNIAAPEITVREDAPENLRHFVLDAAVELGLGPHALRDEICSLLHVRPDPSNWSAYPNVWGEVEDHVYGCQWFRVYDVVEQLYDTLHEGDQALGTQRATEFQDSLNQFFVEEGIGWQLENGEIVMRGTEAFEAAVSGASAALEDVGRETAQAEIHEALADLSRRPQPDVTGAIQHAMAALECVCRDAVGNPRATLGDIMKRYPDLVPKPLDHAIEKAWGYASEMGRHSKLRSSQSHLAPM